MQVPSTEPTALLRRFFAKLGYDAAIADIYLALHAQGAQSVAGLARTSGVERTRIYRLTDQLLEAQLISLEQTGSRSRLRAAPLAQVRVLLAERAQAVANLQDELAGLERVLDYTSLRAPGLSATLYTGADGLRQAVGHALASGVDIYRYEQQPRLGFLAPDDQAAWLNGWRASHAKLYVLHTQPTASAASQLPRSISRQLPHDLDMDVYGDSVVRYYRQAGQTHALVLTDAPLAASLQTQFLAAWQAAVTTS